MTFGYGSDITFTNCYYVPVENLPTTQGTAAHAISAGTNVTSLAISTTPTTTYNVSGITLYGDNKGLMIGDVVYAAENDEVDLTLAAPSQPGATVGFVASAGTLDQTDATHATLTMPNEDVTISADYLVNTNYIAADGTSQSHAAKQLTSSDHELTSGWYVVSEDVGITPYTSPDNSNFKTRRITVNGDVKLILADGATLDAAIVQYYPDWSQEIILEAPGGIHVPEGSSLTIYGQSQGTGTINAATNSSNQAAIGGGNVSADGVNNSAGTITIYGGKVTATSWGEAGIGGGGTYVDNMQSYGSFGGTVNIYGGTITAQGGMSSAAIGGGSGCTGFTVNIYGGTINATSGAMAAAIGGGSQSTGGTVNIYGGNITANAIDYGAEIPTDGFGIGSGTSYKSLATVNLSWTNATDHITATSYNGTVNLLKDFTATDGGSWLQGNGIVTKPDGKTLYPANTLLFLADNDDNSADISAANGNTRNVVLSGRTLYKDGKWNTLCLPFSVDNFVGTPLQGATVKTLASTGFTGGTLTLNFEEATAIAAGKPYIVKWANGTDIVNPVFNGVTISDATANVSTDYVDFVGCYSPVGIYTAEKTNLYLGADNTLYYPTETDFKVNAFRGYFQLKQGLTAGEPSNSNQASVRAFKLNFGDGEATGIISVHDSGFMVNGSDAWYTIDGRKLDGKPTRAGVYINNGKKVAIK